MVKILASAMVAFLLYCQPGECSELKIKKIPLIIAEGDPIYRSAPFIRVAKKRLFVIDNLKHRILVYHIGRKMRFSYCIGRPGQGPGDFVFPTVMDISNGRILVKDNGSFSIFTAEGACENKFRFFDSISTLNVVFMNDKIFCASMNPNHGHLIDVYDTFGKKLNAFGNRYIGLKDFCKSVGDSLNPFSIYGYFYRNIITSEKKYIYYLDRMFGWVFKFGEEGKLIYKRSIIDIFGSQGRDILSANRKILRKGIKRRQGRLAKKLLFKYARAIGNRMYIFGYENYYWKRLKGEYPDEFNLKIRQLDIHSLELLNTFTARINNRNEFIIAVDVVEQNKEPVFWVSFFSRRNEHFIARMTR